MGDMLKSLVDTWKEVQEQGRINEERAAQGLEPINFDEETEKKEKYKPSCLDFILYAGAILLCFILFITAPVIFIFVALIYAMLTYKS